MRGVRSYPNLDQSLHQFLLHDARERRSVRITIALVMVVKIRMRVEVKQAEVFVLPRERPHDRMRNRVISAERYRSQSIGDQRVDRVLDKSIHLASRHWLNVTGVKEDRIVRQV